MKTHSMITVANTAGSWMLKRYIVIVAHKGLYFAKPDAYYVEITDHTLHNVFVKSIPGDDPCVAAVDALIAFLGPRSKEVNEFVTHYPCKGGKPNPPAGGWPVDNDLDGVRNVPAWIRP